MPQVVRLGNRKSQTVPTFETTSTSGALALTIDPSYEFQLVAVTAHLESGITAAENLTVNLDAGDGSEYDTTLHTESFVSSVSNLTEIAVTFGDGYEFEKDDKIVVSCPNSLAKKIGLRVVYKEY